MISITNYEHVACDADDERLDQLIEASRRCDIADFSIVMVDDNAPLLPQYIDYPYSEQAGSWEDSIEKMKSYIAAVGD